MLHFEQTLLDIVFSLYPESKSTLSSGSVSSDISVNFLDIPPKPELGDFAFSTFPLAKVTKLAPPVIAEKIAIALRERGDIFQNVSTLGGYVNFFLTPKIWIEVLEETQVSDKAKKTETIIVDYIGANAGKPLHIGHLCTPSVGQVIINTHEYLGYKVIGDSHFGDWGGIFGKLIHGWNEFGKLKGEDYNNTELENKGAQYLLDLYQWIYKETVVSEDSSTEERAHAEKTEMMCREEFRYLSGVGIDMNNLEDKKHHDQNALLWEKFTAVSVTEINKKLELLNVFPQYNIGESFYEGLDLPRPNNEDYPNLVYGMNEIVQELIEKGIASKNEDGSVGVVFPEETKIPSCVLQKKDGTGLYLTSDVTAIKYRLTNGWNPSKILYSVDMRQQLHLKQAITIAKMAWPELTKNVELYHAFNGFIKLKDGAMSTRKGNLIFLEKLIDEGFERTRTILSEKGQSLSDDDTRSIAVAAIKYSYLAQDREKDVTFDWDKALSFEGNSGPYIQYSYVRAKNIIDKVDSPYVLQTKSIDREKLQLSSYDSSCLRKLAFFDKAVYDSATKCKPHTLANYCYELASEFSSFYAHTPKILEEEDENIKKFRLILVQKVQETLKKGFELLAINMPEKM